jgi:DMSO/TMAO reductase YedYZ heme-binding membrane subunit
MQVAGATNPPVTRQTPARGPLRLSVAALAVMGAVIGLVAIFATDQVLPATSEYQAQIRIWLGARAAGFTALVLLAAQVTFGLVLSHPTNKTTWRLSKRLFPWHENAWIFTLSFTLVHMLAIAADRYANVGILGALVPGMSEYRSVPVAVGTLALYALLLTGLTARFTRLLPAGWWLRLHRLGLAVLGLAWMHGVLAGTDTNDLGWLYGVTFAVVALAAAYRYWIVRSARPTFASTLEAREHQA